MTMYTVALVLLCLAFPRCQASDSCAEKRDESSLLALKSSRTVSNVKKHDAVLVDQIPTVKIESTCSFINTDTNAPARILGEAPQGDGPLPLAVYLLGTFMGWGSSVSVAFHEQMAQRGFYSISIEYENQKYQTTCDSLVSKASNVAGCINTLCKQEDIDCSLGLALYGWSQGGQVSSLVGNYVDFPVTAWLGFSCTYINYGKTAEGGSRQLAQEQCLGGAHLKVPQHKRRLLIGDHDGQMGGDGSSGSGKAATIIEDSKKILGPLSCKTDYDCIQEDGSGYYVATKAETGLDMVHMWFILVTVGADQSMSASLQPVFVNPPDPSAEWGEKTSFDWLAKAALTSNKIPTEKIESGDYHYLENIGKAMY